MSMPFGPRGGGANFPFGAPWVDRRLFPYIHEATLLLLLVRLVGRVWHSCTWGGLFGSDSNGSRSLMQGVC